MEKIRLLQRGIPVNAIRWELQANPQLWNEFNDRTKDEKSPHFGLDDIWCRFGSQEDAKRDGPHESRWYPSADILGVKPICLDIMRFVNGVELGGVLITRIPPGAVCRPHKDPGWHARRYDKFALQLASAPGQKFCFEGEELETKPGDLFFFDNSHTHWVTNQTDHERITMIVCIRREP